MQSRTVGIRDAKIHLSRLIRMVRKGSEIILTDRGQPVGKIVPIHDAELPLSVRITRLEDQGLLEICSGKNQGKIPYAIPVQENIAQIFLKEDRGLRSNAKGWRPIFN